ncbi:MAG TPA: 3-methyl-2-oxobutanoate dehydrogenase subunit VorB [Candidatus Deferrimicrobiaceae bacterium]|nr:3-methyl-2-oxobutanoate dehydrogenase subunit VorB [Candidatus Deferrimicrobiaceae bacterium]
MTTATAKRPAAAPKRVLWKGNEAIAEAAIQAGCDAYFGYPITPQAELLEWMARRMPEQGRAFVQAESELGAINMALGAAATGARVLVSSSSPGISLMAEGMSYMAGQEVPMVLVDVMRGGPGLGSIGPAQGDYLQLVKGHGHGDYRVPVLAPASIAEAIAIVADAFELAERYRTPVAILADGTLGQAMEPVVPAFRDPPRRPSTWQADGAAGRAPRVVKSLDLQPEDLERHNDELQAKFRTIAEREVRWAGEHLDDAEIVVVAYGTAARVARTAIARAREGGLRAGLFRPITLWPYPTAALHGLARRARAILVVELSAGQMLEDVRLAVEGVAPIAFHGRTGGMVPSPGDVVDELRRLWSITEPVGQGHRRRRQRIGQPPATEVADHGDQLDDAIAAEELPALAEVWR